jgi:hypothetical protein
VVAHRLQSSALWLETKFHAHKASGRNTVLYILILTLSDRRREINSASVIMGSEMTDLSNEGCAVVKRILVTCCVIHCDFSVQATVLTP